MPTTDPWDTMVMDTAMDTMDMDTDMAIMPMLLMDIMDFITTNLFNVVKNWGLCSLVVKWVQT